MDSVGKIGGLQQRSMEAIPGGHRCGGVAEGGHHWAAVADLAGDGGETNG